MQLPLQLVTKSGDPGKMIKILQVIHKACVMCGNKKGHFNIPFLQVLEQLQKNRKQHFIQHFIKNFKRNNIYMNIFSLNSIVLSFICQKTDFFKGEGGGLNLNHKISNTQILCGCFLETQETDANHLCQIPASCQRISEIRKISQVI